MQKDVCEFSLAQWKAFFYSMVTRFHDGMFFEAGTEGSAEIVDKAKYTSWWLNLLGPKSAGLAQNATSFDSKSTVSGDDDRKDKGLGVREVLLIATISALVGLGFGFWEAGRSKKGYQMIPH